MPKSWFVSVLVYFFQRKYIDKIVLQGVRSQIVLLQVIYRFGWDLFHVRVLKFIFCSGYSQTHIFFICLNSHIFHWYWLTFLTGTNTGRANKLRRETDISDRAKNYQREGVTAEQSWLCGTSQTHNFKKKSFV